MKKILTFLRQTIGLALIKWLVIFVAFMFALQLLNTLSITWPIPLVYASFSVSMIAYILLLIFYVGYLFRIAQGFFKQEQKPLSPLALSKNFKLSLRVFAFLLILLIPIFILMFLMYAQISTLFSWLILLYFVFVFLPLYVGFVITYPSLPRRATYRFILLKNANKLFGLVFQTGIIFFVWSLVAGQIMNLSQTYSTSALREAGFALMLLLSWIYVLFVWAAAIGISARRIKQSEATQK